MSERIGIILQQYRTVAVVGCSRDPSKEAYSVPSYLKKVGYRIIPINPYAGEILGEKAFKSLGEMPDDLKTKVDIVEIFRPSDEVPPVVDQAIEMKQRLGVPHVIWMQLGIGNDEAAERARSAGITVIMDKCMRMEHQRLLKKGQ